jgi:hypothetical protein
LPAVAGAAPQPPSGRGYELVSPVDKNGGGLQNVLRTSADGHSIAWQAQVAFADARSANIIVNYVSRRGASGWDTHAYVPAYQGDALPGTPGQEKGISFPDDLSAMTFVSLIEMNPEDQDNNPGFSFGGNDVFRVGLGTPVADWLSHGEGALTGNGLGRTADLGGVSSDGSSVLFTSNEQLTSDAPANTLLKLYRWRDGQVEFVGRAPDGTALSAAAYLGVGATNSSGGGSQGINPDSMAVNRDGSRFVYGAAIAGVRQVFLHIDGEPVRQISMSQSTATAGAPAAANSIFVAATPDFSKIVFQTADQLTDNAPASGGDYLYDVASGGLTYLFPDDSLTQTSSFVNGNSGIAQMSSDGSYIYFVSQPVLAPGATVDSRNLYVWHDGDIKFIATLDPTNDRYLTASSKKAAAPPYSEWTATSLDAAGDKFVFQSFAQLVPGTDTNGRAMVYLYDDRTESIACLSCIGGGRPSQGDSDLSMNGIVDDVKFPTPKAITADGSTVAFTSNDQLVPGDTNNVGDVYEYADGRLSLVSGGTSGDRSVFRGLSPDGKDLYFTTNQAMVPRDTDGGLIDIYDARDGGGEPAVEPVTPCRDDECQGTPSPRVRLDVPGTMQVDGTDETEDPSSTSDVETPLKPSVTVEKLTAAQRSRLAHGGRVVITAKTNSRGRVSVVLTAKVGHGRRRVASSSKFASRAATVRIPIKLTRQGLRTLRKLKKLHISAKVTLTGSAGSRSQSFVIRAARTAKKHARGKR